MQQRSFHRLCASIKSDLSNGTPGETPGKKLPARWRTAARRALSRSAAANTSRHIRVCAKPRAAGLSPWFLMQFLRSVCFLLHACSTRNEAYCAPLKFLIHAMFDTGARGRSHGAAWISCRRAARSAVGETREPRHWHRNPVWAVRKDNDERSSETGTCQDCVDRR